MAQFIMVDESKEMMNAMMGDKASYGAFYNYKLDEPQLYDSPSQLYASFDLSLSQGFYIQKLAKLPDGCRAVVFTHDDDNYLPSQPCPLLFAYKHIIHALSSVLKPKCFHCGEGNKPMQYCGRCGYASYCDADCQKQDRNTHKKYCYNIERKEEVGVKD